MISVIVRVGYKAENVVHNLLYTYVGTEFFSREGVREGGGVFNILDPPIYGMQKSSHP